MRVEDNGGDRVICACRSPCSARCLSDRCRAWQASTRWPHGGEVALHVELGGGDGGLRRERHELTLAREADQSNQGENTDLSGMSGTRARES